MQRQQAQRNADQAESQARALKSQARDAESVANQAQEDARSLNAQASQAQGEALSARQSVNSIKLPSEPQSQLSDVLAKVNATLNPPEAAAKTESLTPVVNSFGQQIGKVVNVTA
jgi:hypothetical protein